MAFTGQQQQTRGCKTKLARVSFIALLAVALTDVCRVEYPAASPADTAHLAVMVDGA